MKWTKQKPKVSGLYWWQRRKKTKAYLLKVEQWKMADELYISAVIIDTCSGEDNDIQNDDSLPFAEWDHPKYFGGYWSDVQIEKPHGYK